MNQKEINELRRRFRPEKSAISRVYGCYVNSSKEIVSDLDESLGMMPQEESEKYLSLLKKGLSGSLGKNLIDIVFSTQQVADSEEHRLLTTLWDSQLKDNEARQTFYRNFKDKYDLINWYFDKLVLQSFEQIGMGNTVGESLTQKFEFILNEKAFFTEAFRSDYYNSVKEHDFELILQFYKDLIARKTSRPLEEEMEFLLEMYCRGSVYMTEKWVLGGMKDTPRRMSDKLVEAMPPKLEKVFSELELL